MVLMKEQNDPCVAYIYELNEEDVHVSIKLNTAVLYNCLINIIFPGKINPRRICKIIQDFSSLVVVYTEVNLRIL